jgi:hypothetical protein
MKLFYSVGGGLGHLTRFSAFLNSMQIVEPVTVIASSPFARDSRVVDRKHNVLIPPFRAARSREDLIVWLQQTIDELKPEQMYVDAFPAGILGELCGVVLPEPTQLFLLARIIKWTVYQERIPTFNLRFKKVFELEQLDEQYKKFLQSNAEDVETMVLKRPVSNEPFAEIPVGSWLVIHSGPDSELEALLEVVSEDYRQQTDRPEVFVIYPGKRPQFVSKDFAFLSAYPVSAAYEKAARVYSAAGFNMVDQMHPYRSRHYVMPFERILDDQFERCRQHQSEFAAVLR